MPIKKTQQLSATYIPMYNEASDEFKFPMPERSASLCFENENLTN